MRLAAAPAYLAFIILFISNSAGALTYSRENAPEALLIVASGTPAERKLTWTSCGPRCWHTEATLDGVVATADLTPTGDGPLALHFVAHTDGPRWLRRVALQLTLPTKHVSVIGRDRRLVRTTHALLDRFDPKWIAIDRGAVQVDDTVDEVVVRWANDTVAMALAPLDADARPFAHDLRCNANWHTADAKVPMPLRRVLPQDLLSADALLYFDPPPLPLVKALFPDGRAASLTITDHADQTSLPTLKALAFGRSDHVFTDGHGVGERGLVGHHLTITKSLFAHGTDRVQLENPVMVALADVLWAFGWEIIPHTATPRPDDRATTERALELFARWHARTFIDHQPETNCEGFGNRGFEAGGHYGIADLLAEAGYEYIWAERDAPPSVLNLLQPQHLEARAPILWPLGRLRPATPSSLWMWRASWFFVESSRFYRLLAPAPLDALEKERGLAVLHTYLESFHPPHHLYGNNNLLIAPGGKTPMERALITLDPRFEKLLDNLAERQRRGTLWVPTLGELADRLRAVAGVRVRCDDHGMCRLHSDVAIKGATFIVPGAVAVDVRWGDGAPRGILRAGGETIFWDDLPAGDTVVALRSS